MLTIDEAVSILQGLSRDDGIYYDAALERVGELVKGEVVRRIGSTVPQRMTPQPGTWPPLAPSTVAAKGHARFLYETGDFKKRVYHRVTSPFSVRVFTDLDYIRFPEYGTTTQPARPVFVPSAWEHQREIEALVGEAVIEAFEKAR